MSPSVSIRNTTFVEFRRTPANDIIRSLKPIQPIRRKRATGMVYREAPRARRHPMTIAIDYRPGHQRRWESCVLNGEAMSRLRN
jgi:hypothetical protein